MPRPAITQKVRDTVKYLRHVKRQRQRDIAAALGISQGAVSRILNDRKYE
jgi:transcriptional regulator with XRE-family HTH domain